jgi:hypothetical protein
MPLKRLNSHRADFQRKVRSLTGQGQLFIPKHFLITATRLSLSCVYWLISCGELLACVELCVEQAAEMQKGLAATNR